MDAFVVRGGRPLRGTVRASGAKNSALKLLAAALLARGTSTIRNTPAIADVAAMAAVLEHLGVAVRRDRDELVLDVPDEVGSATPPDLVQRLRASIVVLGPLLARNGWARVAQPGGCNLGHRGIDLHLKGLEALGATITYGEDFVEARAPQGGLRAGEIELPYASVGATENLLMAAVLARGTTRIGNAAREPEIVDLCRFLQAMGARIRGEGSPDIVVDGVDALAPADHHVVGDRIEAGTYAVAAAITGGDLRIEGVDAAHLRLPLQKLAAAGAEVATAEDGAVHVRGPRTLRAIEVATLPYPGFATDLQPQFLVLLSQAAGTSMLTENVFDGRFGIVEQLRTLGAEIALEAHHIVLRGPRKLLGTTVRATDLRAGAALVLAGLVADGETVVVEPHHVDRGYEDLVGKLQAVGASIAREGRADLPPALAAAARGAA